MLNVASPRERPFLILAGFCGMRKSEALASSRSAIKDGSLRVSQQVENEEGRGFYIMAILKTDQSYRNILLPAEAEELLAGESIFLCPDDAGGFISPKNIQRDLDALCLRAGVDRITSNELRHTFISLLENDLECPRAIVCALSGKSFQGVTADYYHTRPDQLRKWIERLWNAAKEAGQTAKRFREA